MSCIFCDLFNPEKGSIEAMAAMSDEEIDEMQLIANKKLYQAILEDKLQKAKDKGDLL